MELLSALGKGPTRVLGYALGVWAGTWGVYYLLQETRRYWALRARQRKHPLRIRDGESDAEWFGQADDAERGRITSRFATLRFCGRYLNVTPEWREQGLWEWMWWKVVHTTFFHGRFGWDGGFSRDEKTEEGRKRIESLLPVEPLDTQRLWGTGSEPAAPSSGISYTWCLHGLSILTDPVFGKQPLESVLSPTRMRPMPCTIHDIRNVDVVLVSHNHFDHLDLSVVPHISRRARWIVPKGVAPLLVRRGVPRERITELSWWDETEEACRVAVQTASGVEAVERTVRLAAVPASHWSARTPLDTNTTLWNSYAVRVCAPEAPDARLFFCGDSGYSASLFQAIGRMYGPFELATIPIGSYEPRWHLSLQHMDPHGSVCVARDVGARTSFGMHWGTWSMSDEHWDDPPKDLARALEAEALPSSFLRTVPFGATQDIRM
ncbi:N-acetylphosphatidylethanolamine-hydrolyzing phospholipase D [Malassezia obtusa]|uniref:N-acetylphosphatidylethanolamine-hydrolyzing phospholipase D n=1 Tax=Malassezia obtusa TaxID=76774 RepID=A0AAF0DY35_9BASI|nr:N-acetylphosphatidylethanolamine-hydrolyzing phospholipase D [Malassezia obtusa]